MIEPLILKPQPNNISEGVKNKILTAAELKKKFTDKSYPIFNKNSSSFTPKLSKILPSDKQSLPLASHKDISKQFQIFNAANSFPFIPDNNLSIPIIKKGCNSSCRQKIVKSVNQLNKKIKSPKQFSIEVHKLMSNKENICLTERAKTPMSTKNKSFAFKMNINLQNKGSLTSRNINDQNYFRKASDASTLSLKTKHTTSMQQLEDDNDSLFSRPQLSSVLQNSKQPNILLRLEQAKKKLYQQIYSLDKKLLNNYEEKIDEPPRQHKQKLNKKTIVISLKKKQLKYNESSNHIGV